jgi:hypothetical protein
MHLGFANSNSAGVIIELDDPEISDESFERF